MPTTRADSKPRPQGLYQFLPKALDGISRQQTVQHKGKNLKSAYIIDLAHSMLLRRHFTKSDVLSVSSQVLKGTYGRDYASYVEYLVDEGIISMQSDYSAGNRCRLYRIDRSVAEGPCTRHVNNDPWLIKKRVERRYDLNPRNGINEIMKLKLIANLGRVQVDHEAAISHLMASADDPGSLQRTTYSVDSVRDGHLFWHFDDYGRFHSNFTIMKSFIRQNCLTIDGDPVCEVDIPNSQPLFLARLMSGDPRVDPREFESFLASARAGRLYDTLSTALGGSLSRSQVKKAVYQVLFGQNRRDSNNSTFRNLFPSVHAFIVEYKKSRGDYRSLAYDLQRAESDFVYNKVLLQATSERGDLGFVTVHDSILVRTQDREFLRAHFDDCMGRLFG
jgi:hypothetical protein